MVNLNVLKWLGNIERMIGGRLIKRKYMAKRDQMREEVKLQSFVKEKKSEGD